jgi:hypothetical protein
MCDCCRKIALTLIMVLRWALERYRLIATFDPQVPTFPALMLTSDAQER